LSLNLQHLHAGVHGSPLARGRHGGDVVSEAPVVTHLRAAAAVLIALIGMVVTTPATAQQTPPSEREVDDGRLVYDDLCATCHGRDMVSPGLVTFDLRTFPKDDPARFRNSVLNGKGTAMPAWQGKVSEDDLKALWAYVRAGP
jgi:mono/diheme cytochrome c family protein